MQGRGHLFRPLPIAFQGAGLSFPLIPMFHSHHLLKYTLLLNMRDWFSRFPFLPFSGFPRIIRFGTINAYLEPTSFLAS